MSDADSIFCSQCLWNVGVSVSVCVCLCESVCIRWVFFDREGVDFHEKELEIHPSPDCTENVKLFLYDTVKKYKEIDFIALIENQFIYSDPPALPMPPFDQLLLTGRLGQSASHSVVLSYAPLRVAIRVIVRQWCLPLISQGASLFLASIPP